MTGMLANLPYTDGREIEVRFFYDHLEAIKYLQEDKATTTADEYGAINLWIGDDGNYHCELSYYGFIQESKTEKNINKIKKIIKKWLKQIK